MNHKSLEEGNEIPSPYRMFNRNSPLRYRRRWRPAVLVFLITTFVFTYYECQSWVGSASSASASRSWRFLPDRIFPERPNKLWTKRAEAVKETYRAAYGKYVEYSFPSDELKPLTNESVNNFNGWGVTAVDSIDTMILMGLTDEYEQVKQHVANTDFTRASNPIASIPFFETIIRYLGGLLSAYHLSEDAVFLSAADDLAKTLLSAFDTPSGFPSTVVEFSKGKASPGKSSYLGSRLYLAEIGSCQLEYKSLAHLTRRLEYFTKSDNVTRHLHRYQLQDLSEDKPHAGLLETVWESHTGEPMDKHYTIGALTDSTYEYLLKGYLISGKTETYLLEMYMESMRAALNNLVFLSPTRNLMYITEIVSNAPVGNMQHLSCYFPGLLALGNHLLPDSVYASSNEKKIFELAAEGLAETCYILYADQITGLGPEIVQFLPYSNTGTTNSASYETGRWMKHIDKWIEDGNRLNGRGVPGVHRSSASPLRPLRGSDSNTKGYWIKDAGWYLRPEAVEAMYLMWRTTGKTIWRERAWEMYLAMEKYAKLPNGAYATILNVDKDDGSKANSQQSYFFAETLKYLYLTFMEEDPWPLDKFVFNTEAHPLPIFSWTEDDKRWFGIS